VTFKTDEQQKSAGCVADDRQKGSDDKINILMFQQFFVVARTDHLCSAKQLKAVHDIDKMSLLRIFLPNLAISTLFLHFFSTLSVVDQTAFGS